MVDVLDIRKLRMLAELDRLGTIAAVARSLRLTPPGVSMQIAALEREVGLRLTERNGRRVALTPAGRLLARHGHDIVDMLSIAEMEAAALREGLAGNYRLAAFPSAARTIVADTWKTLLNRPELRLTLRLIEMEPQDALPALSAGEVELVVSHNYSNMSGASPIGVTATRIASEAVWLAVRAENPEESGAQKAAELPHYAASDWIVPHRQWACFEMVQRACGAAGFAPHAVAEATDFAVQLELVSAGVGVALVPQLAAVDPPPNVRLLPLSTPVYRHDYVVTRQSSQADPGIQRLQALLTDAASRLVPAAAGIPSEA